MSAEDQMRVVDVIRRIRRGYKAEARGQEGGMQIRSAKDPTVYQKAYRLAMADDRDQKTEDRRQC